MSTQKNAELARRFFEDFCTGRQRELADTLMSADFVYHDPQIPGVRGPEAMAAALAQFQEGVNGHWGIDEIIPGESDRVTVRWTGTGRHTAPVMGIPPTGNAVRVSAISVLRVADGKIAEHWCVWDTLGFLQQVGVAPMSEQTVR